MANGGYLACAGFVAILNREVQVDRNGASASAYEADTQPPAQTHPGCISIGSRNIGPAVEHRINV